MGKYEEENTGVGTIIVFYMILSIIVAGVVYHNISYSSGVNVGVCMFLLTPIVGLVYHYGVRALFRLERKGMKISGPSSFLASSQRKSSMAVPKMKRGSSGKSGIVRFFDDMLPGEDVICCNICAHVNKVGRDPKKWLCKASQVAIGKDVLTGEIIMTDPELCIVVNNGS